MAFRKIVGSYKDYTLSSHVIEAGYLAVDTVSGDLRIGDGTTAGGTLLARGSGATGNITFYGTKLVSSTSISVNDPKVDPLTAAHDISVPSDVKTVLVPPFVNIAVAALEFP